MTINHGLVIEVDRQKFQDNYRTFQEQCTHTQVAAVVKADAYGCGITQLAPLLIELGCRTFFVAHLEEAIELRTMIEQADIYVLNGLLPGSAPAYRANRLKPVITSIAQIYEWLSYCKTQNWNGGAALHIDSGIHRMGFRIDEISFLTTLSKRELEHFDLVMSHFACADQPEDKRNGKQIEKFTWARRQLSAIPKASLAASAGCFLGKDAFFDLVRPGIGLFGGNPFAELSNPFSPVVSAHTRLLQIKKHRKGDFVGYGNEYCLDQDMLVGALSVGYADGLPRRAGAQALDFYMNGIAVSAIGRISMDITLVNLNPVRGLKPQVGDMVEIFGKNRCINAFAALIDTIPNEVMTSFGRRGKRNLVSTRH